MKKQKYISVILGIITTITLLLNYEKIYSMGIKSVKNIMIISPIVCTFLFGVITYFLYKIELNGEKTNWLQKLIAFSFSIIMVIGKSYEATDSWNLIIKNKITVSVSIFATIGYFILFNYIFKFLNNKINKIDLSKIKFIKDNKLIKFFEDKPFISSLIAIILFWLIYIVAFYPGILTPDSSYQILQAFNIHTKYSNWIIPLDSNVNITNHHPVLHTLMLGGCVKLGRKILDDNFGIFIYTLLQVGILSFTLAYTIKYLKKINISSKVRFIVLAVYCIVPMFPFYAITAVKDTIYTSFMILYFIRLYDFIKFNKDEKISIKNMIVILLLGLAIALFRNNGIYVVALSLLPAVFYSKRNIKRIAFAFIIYIVIYKLYTGMILPYFKISNTSIREALSIPFQQTARYVKEYEKDVTEHEIEVIDKILIYRTINRRYKPEIADPVKNKYNKYTTKEELNEYLQIWKDGFFKHPDSYIQAFISNTYGYFYPTNKDWYLYYNKKDIVNKKGNINYTFNENTKGLRRILKESGNLFRNVPGIGLISNIGFNTCIILVISVYFIMQKGKRRYLIVLIPHLVTILVCLASPVNNYFRYSMPYIFALPITMVLFFKEINNKKYKEAYDELVGIAPLVEQQIKREEEENGEK